MTTISPCWNTQSKRPHIVFPCSNTQQQRQLIMYSNNNNAINCEKLAVIVCYEILNRNVRTTFPSNTQSKRPPNIFLSTNTQWIQDTIAVGFTLAEALVYLETGTQPQMMNLLLCMKSRRDQLLILNNLAGGSADRIHSILKEASETQLMLKGSETQSTCEWKRLSDVPDTQGIEGVIYSTPESFNVFPSINNTTFWDAIVIWFSMNWRRGQYWHSTNCQRWDQ